MNEEFDPTLEIGISGTGMSEEDTQKAVQNIEAADIENGIVEPEQEVPEEVVPEEAKPEDPVSENMDILNNKPVKAFIYQDHEAHLIVHMSFRDDPKMKQIMAQNPKAQLMLAAMEAHIAEHVGFEYRRQIEEQLGSTLPPPNSVMDETSEMGIARITAKAAKKPDSMWQ